MTHGRMPRKPRSVRSPMMVAWLRATKLTAEEVADTMQHAHCCADRLREGVATEDQHTALHTSLMIAHGIESRGIVRGLLQHLTAATEAMAAIRARATATGTWRPTALYFHELEAIATALELHEFQLQQVSAGEIQAITAKLIAQTLSSGGIVMRTSGVGLTEGAAA